MPPEKRVTVEPLHLKSRCCPKATQRKVTRSIHEPSRDIARAISQTAQYAISCKLRKKVASLALAGFDGEVQCGARVTSSTSQPPPKTSESSQNSSHHPKTPAQHERAQARLNNRPSKIRKTTDFFNGISSEPSSECFRQMTALRTAMTESRKPQPPQYKFRRKRSNESLPGDRLEIRAVVRFLRDKL